MAGPDQIPWPCRTQLRDGELVLERNVADSGKFHIPWPVEGHGEVVLCTGTLMERARPYQLLVELARGKVNQVRNQIADWQAMGLVLSAKVEAALQKALGHLSRAVTSQYDVAKAAEQAREGDRLGDGRRRSARGHLRRTGDDGPPPSFVETAHLAGLQPRK